jgi:hypothetical protein
LEAAERRWVRSLAEGLASSLTGYGLALAMAFGTRWTYRFDTPQRAVMLGIACTTWVLCAFGAIKITEREPGAIVAKWRTAMRWTLRAGAIGSIMLPFIICGTIPSEFPDSEIAFAELTLLGLLSLAAGFLYYPQLFCLALRTKSRILVAATALLSMTGGVWYIVTACSSDPTLRASLERLMELPTLQFGSLGRGREMVDLWRYHLLELSYQHEPGLTGLAAMLIFAISAAVHATLFVKLCLILRARNSERTAVA